MQLAVRHGLDERQCGSQPRSILAQEMQGEERGGWARRFGYTASRWAVGGERESRSASEEIVQQSAEEAQMGVWRRELG